MLSGKASQAQRAVTHKYSVTSLLADPSSSFRQRTSAPLRLGRNPITGNRHTATTRRRIGFVGSALSRPTRSVLFQLPLRSRRDRPQLLGAYNFHATPRILCRKDDDDDNRKKPEYEKEPEAPGKSETKEEEPIEPDKIEGQAFDEASAIEALDDSESNKGNSNGEGESSGSDDDDEDDDNGDNGDNDDNEDAAELLEGEKVQIANDDLNPLISESSFPLINFQQQNQTDL